MIWHRLRGHRIEAFRVVDASHPWRWQCSCGRVFGHPPLHNGRKGQG